jgi:hypothetical protein
MYFNPQSWMPKTLPVSGLRWTLRKTETEGMLPGVSPGGFSAAGSAPCPSQMTSSSSPRACAPSGFQTDYLMLQCLSRILVSM